MKANKDIAIVDDELVLVPYRPEHVPKYHEWMCSDEIRERTASEPLTLEEEYEAQREWQEEDDKLTFIVCARDDPLQPITATLEDIKSGYLTMIGDVNLFLWPRDEGVEAEVMIMIAESEYRRRGLAFRAMQLMLSYITSPSSQPPLPIPKEKIFVRIGEKNTSSICLFEKLGFVFTKRIEVFEEVEMRYQNGGEHWAKGSVVPLS